MSLSSRVLEGCYTLSSYCFDPVCYLRKGIVLFHAYPKVKNLPQPAWQYQAVIIAKMAIAIILLPFATPCAFVFRGIASLVDEKKFLEFHVAKMGVPNDSTDNNANQISILSWNLCGVGGGYSVTDGGVVPIEARIDAIARSIIAQACDLFFGQEVMDIQDAKQLRDQLQDGGFTHFYYHMNGGTPLLGPSSGLFVASKMQLTNPHFTPFTFINDSNNHSKSHKGVFCCSVEIADQKITCMNTHLSYSLHVAQPTASEIQRRVTQLDTCSAVIQDCNTPILLLGDFNLANTEESPPQPRQNINWQESIDMQNQQIQPTWLGDEASVYFCQQSCLFADPEKQSSDTPQRLDRTWYANLPNEWTVTTTVLPEGTDCNPKEFDYNARSDHYPVLTKLIAA